MENIDIILELVACKTLIMHFFFILIYWFIYVYTPHYFLFILERLSSIWCPHQRTRPASSQWWMKPLKVNTRVLTFWHCTLNKGIFFKLYFMYVLDNRKNILFFTFLVSDVLRKPHSPGLGSGSSPGTRTSMERLTPKVLQ